MRQNKKERYNQLFMGFAFQLAQQMSFCEDKKVGCVIVKNGNVISLGWNGMPSGWDNCCEDDDGQSLPEVLHAEANAITKLARSTETGEGSSLYTSYRPCLECAKLLSQVYIKEVYYSVTHTNPNKNTGIEYLKKCKIPAIYLPFQQ